MAATRKAPKYIAAARADAISLISSLFFFLLWPPSLFPAPFFPFLFDDSRKVGRGTLRRDGKGRECTSRSFDSSLQLAFSWRDRKTQFVVLVPLSTLLDMSSLIHTPYQLADCADQLYFPVGGTYTHSMSCPSPANSPPYRFSLPYTWIKGDASPPA